MPRFSKETRKRAFGSSLLIFISLLIIVISTNSLSGLPEKIGLTIMAFIQKTMDTSSSFFKNTINSISELSKLQESNRELLGRIEQLGNIERDFSELKRENERLKEQLGYSFSASHVYLSAKIIAKDPVNIYTSFIINKGAINGVTKNSAVVAYQDGSEGLVGRVIEVANSSCIVTPIFDNATYVAVKLERSRYDGLALGQGNTDLPLLVKYVKKRAVDEIQYGDLVVTSGMQSLYPSGIGVGRVSKVINREYLTSLELEVEPVLDFGKLEYVFIVGNANTENTEGPDK